eukprot:TRINITY_DN5272_c0_g1_i2.p1 TRINITY_DN5272_c0_g1~~TRINITY_DN5272_c0_g1_i2.p1  ORF type:complete len:228 (-),score=38.70 TRINITY_DN5272_c0_g1_i2:245-928(-)
MNRSLVLGPHKFMPNIVLRFNLSNEPCTKYALSLMADRGVKLKDLACHRFKTHVLFVESAGWRYELSLSFPREEKQQTSIDNPPQNHIASDHTQQQQQQQQQQDRCHRIISDDSDQSSCHDSGSGADGVDGVDGADGTRLPMKSDGCEGHAPPLYRWARVQHPRVIDNEALVREGLPLPSDAITVLASDLYWEDIEWGLCAIRVRGTELSLANAAWYSIRSRKLTLF